MICPSRVPVTRARWPASFLRTTKLPSRRYVVSALTKTKLDPACTQTRTHVEAERSSAAECFAPQREQVTIPSNDVGMDGFSCDESRAFLAAPAAAPRVANNRAKAKAAALPSSTISIQNR